MCRDVFQTRISRHAGPETADPRDTDFSDTSRALRAAAETRRNDEKLSLVSASGEKIKFPWTRTRGRLAWKPPSSYPTGCTHLSTGRSLIRGGHVPSACLRVRLARRRQTPTTPRTTTCPSRGGKEDRESLAHVPRTGTRTRALSVSFQTTPRGARDTPRRRALARAASANVQLRSYARVPETRAQAVS